MNYNLMKINLLIAVSFIFIVLAGCNKDPNDKRLNRQWEKTSIDNSGAIQTESAIMFVGNGQVSFERGYTSWIGEWSTNNGELNISFENGSINGTYSYNVQKKGGGNAVNGVSQSAITDLVLTPIVISDSLESNNLKGLFSSIN